MVQQSTIERRPVATTPAALGGTGAAAPWYERALRRYSVAALRVALGIVFVWFGALKVAEVSPVGRLVAGTLPFLDPDLVVPGLGAVEVALGLVLISGRFVTAVCAAMVAHLAGTFLVYVVQPDVAFQHGNPLLMTTEGEFVAKNIVLITAGLVVAAASRRRDTARRAAPHVRA